jgi:hypothetical protein
MTNHMRDRRRFLLRTTAAVGGFCFGLAEARRASALSIQHASPELADAMALANRCGGVDQAHEAIAQQLETELAAETALSGTTITRTLSCPFCGCPVTVTRTVP